MNRSGFPLLYLNMKFFVRQEFAGDFIFSSLWERSGARGRATAKPTDSHRSSADGFAVRMKRTKAGAGCKILFPVFGGEMATAKIQTVKGLRVEIFSRPLQKNTTRPLTVWIGGTGQSADCFS